MPRNDQLQADRGTETLQRFQRKVEAYVQLAMSGKYREVFGRQYFRVLVMGSATWGDG